MASVQVCGLVVIDTVGWKNVWGEIFAIFANGSNSRNFNRENLFRAKFSPRACSWYHLIWLYYIALVLKTVHRLWKFCEEHVYVSYYVIALFHSDCIKIICIVSLFRTLKFFPNRSIPDLLIDELSPHGTLDQKSFPCHRILYITPLIATLLLSRSTKSMNRENTKNAQSQSASRENKTKKKYFQFEYCSQNFLRQNISSPQ